MTPIFFKLKNNIKITEKFYGLALVTMSVQALIVQSD